MQNGLRKRVNNMDIKELRVGNTIWRPCCYDEVVEIRENGIIGLDNLRGLISYGEIEPIPITEELLLKIGFKKGQGNGYVSYEINPYDGHIIEVAFYISGIDVFIRFICGKCHLRSIKYFHELQNIIRVITGKELTIKDIEQ
jgi:hypothetical protein